MDERGVGFAYACWRRHAAPYSLPPGLKWDGDHIVGTPRLRGVYLLRIPRTDIDFTMTVVKSPDSANEQVSIVNKGET